jgi:hypothetical protein
MAAIDVITPIYAPKAHETNLYLANTIGPSSIGDRRTFAEAQDPDIPNWAQASGVTGNPSVTTGPGVPMPDMACTIKTSGRPIFIDFSGVIALAGTGTVGGAVEIYVNGAPINKVREFSSALASQRQTVKISCIHPLPAGVHTVQIYWASDGVNSVTATDVRRSLSVQEL